MTKKCSKYKTEKKLDEFPRNSSTASGLGYYCTPCQAVAHKNRRKKTYDKKAPMIKKIKKRRCLGYLANGEDCKAMQRGFFCIRHRPDNLEDRKSTRLNSSH